MTDDDLRRWIEAHVRAWRSAGTDPLRDLFTPGAADRPGPDGTPRTGLDEIADFSDAERDGSDDVFELTCEPVAVEHTSGVARVEVVDSRT